MLSPHSLQSSISSTENSHASQLGLIIPTSDTGGAGDFGGFAIPGSAGTSEHKAPPRGLSDDEAETFDIAPGFEFDENGELIEGPVLPRPRPAPQHLPRLGSDSAARARVQQDLQEGLEAGQAQVRVVLCYRILQKR